MRKGLKLMAVAGFFVLGVTVAASPASARLELPTGDKKVLLRTASVPETPAHFRLVKRSGSKLQLNWDWVAGGTGAIHYELSYAGRTLVLQQYYPGYTLDIGHLDLSAGHVYTLNLRAVDEIGNRSAVPAELLFETTPPSSPSNLRQLSTKMGYPDIISFQLSVDAAGPIRGYEVFLNGVSFGIALGVDNEFSLFDQLASSYLPHPVGQASLQLRAYDSSLNASQLSEPLTVIFPE
ncbi:MAG TPA: hypothetical protein VFZ58_04935 [Candidatus Saccharimonadales bacterium]